LKGFHFFLKSGGQGKLSFLGSGPEEGVLRDYVKGHKLNDSVTFRGFLSNEEVKDELKKANVLLHPSFREGGSWSILEAMSFGLPVICLNCSGPKDMVSDKTGILIDVNSPIQIEEDIGKGLLKLSRNLDLFTDLSRNAKLRVEEEYCWRQRGTEMEKIYKGVLGTFQKD
jgi:glycosyltransferase involved in cell wall biosynthesis